MEEKMLTRKEMKKRAKKSVKKHYWIFVAACLISAYLGTEFAGSLTFMEQNQGITENTTEVITVGRNDSPGLVDAVRAAVEGDEESGRQIAEQIKQEEVEQENQVLGRSRGVLASIVNNVTSGSILVTIISAMNSILNSPSITIMILILVGMILVGAFWFFVTNTYGVILRRLFLEGATYEKVQVQKFLYLIHVKKWFKASWVMFVTGMYQLFWSFTLIGGIIKYFSYKMVPYIVAENPDLSAKEAITLSRKMMKGHKWECFVLQLSFIWWYFFGVLTIGLGKILFTNSYWTATFTQYYIQLRKLAKEKEIPGAELLNDTYLYEKPSQEVINQTYADVLEVMASPVEELKELKGIRKFLANWFGILLVGSKKELEYEKSQMRHVRIAGLKEAVEGKVYPNRLFSIPEKNKRKKVEMIYYMRHYTIWSLVLMFFIFSFIGWLWEVSLHLITDGEFVNRGVLQGPWLPIYGMGGMLILILLNKFRKKPVLQFILTVILCGCVEYFTAYYLELTHGGVRWWDYSGYFLNLHGRICAEGLLVFGIGGMAIVYFLAPLLDNQIRKIKLKILVPICLVLLAIFAVDQVYSKKHPNTGEGITDYAVIRNQNQINI